MNKNPTVDIVIPCYNVEHIIHKCIDSLLQQNYKNIINIFLINDASTDTTLKIINLFSTNNVIKIINHKRNLGLSAARNTGIKAGKSEIICFLDSDMVVKSNWVQSHIDIYNRYNAVGAVGNNHLPANQVPNKLDSYLYSTNRGVRKYQNDTCISFRYFLFSNTSLKRSVVNRVGYFDEKIKTYGGEDTDYSIQIWKKFPNQLFFSVKSSSEHFSNKSLEEFLIDMNQYGKNNFPLLLKKFPEYKADLGGGYVSSIKGYLLFNPIVRNILKALNGLGSHYYIIRYLVIDAVIRGARKGS